MVLELAKDTSLVRRLKPSEEIRKLQDEYGDVVPPIMYHGKGCRNCQGTGFRGRTGIFELVVITDEIRELILHRAPAGQVRKVAMEQGMISLRGDGWRLIGEGRTSPNEVLRATKDELTSGTDAVKQTMGIAQPHGVAEIVAAPAGSRN